MKDLWTICKREFAAYFNSAMGYIFLIVFVVLNSGLYVTGFFQFPSADMGSFFALMPFMLSVFVPAVTMRLWAEERTENTVELLLTFPMRPISVVGGKFAAGLGFLCLGLAGTLMVPLMLMVIGDPDVGRIFASYLGSVLLGAFFLALGQLISGFAKDQIVAFVLALVACFGFFLIGTDFAAVAVDSWVSGLGSLLRDLLGVTAHYATFTRGVFEIADLLYFIIWIALFLVLNGLFIEGRGRKQARMVFTGAAIISIFIGLVFNQLIADTSLGRFDWTEGNIYTVSEGTENILSELQVPVQVKYYVTPSSEMPTEMKNLERDVMDKLKEMNIASGGVIDYKRVHMHAANVLPSQKEEEEKQDDPLEKRMLEKGVEPFSIQARRQTGSVSNLVYSSLGIAYKDKPEEIIPQVVPASLGDLEYQLVSTIYRLTRENLPKVLLAAPKEQQNMPPEEIQRRRMMGQPVPPGRDMYGYLERILTQEKYNVQRVDLSDNAPLPDEYDILLLMDPQNLNERRRWELSRALAQGKKVLAAVQHHLWEYNVDRGRIRITRKAQNPGINELLNQYGINVDKSILMDTSSHEIRVARNQLEQMFGGGLGLNLPMHIQVNRETMNLDDPLVTRLSTIFYLWGTALELDDKFMAQKGLLSTVLAETTDQAWRIEPKFRLNQSDVQPPKTGRQAYPVFARITGQFPDVYEGTPRPEWPSSPDQPAPQEENTDVKPVTPAPGEMLLLGSARAFQDDMIRGNLELFLNSVDSLAYGSDLVGVRGHKPINRVVPDISPEAAAFWKVINYGLVGALIAGIGVLRFMLRRRARVRYAESYKA